MRFTVNVSSRCLGAMGLGVIAFLALGCGSGEVTDLPDRPDRQGGPRSATPPNKVFGSVRLRGKPLTRALLTFYSEKDENVARSADVIDGNYLVHLDGGKYRVVVSTTFLTEEKIRRPSGADTTAYENLNQKKLDEAQREGGSKIGKLLREDVDQYRKDQEAINEAPELPQQYRNKHATPLTLEVKEGSTQFDVSVQ